MEGRVRFSHIVASVYLKRSLKASSPTKFQLKYADSSKKTNVQLKQIDKICPGVSFGLKLRSLSSEIYQSLCTGTTITKRPELYKSHLKTIV